MNPEYVRQSTQKGQFKLLAESPRIYFKLSASFLTALFSFDLKQETF